MDTSEFSKIFLPNIVFEYLRGTLPPHALVDIDAWKKVYPYQKRKRGNQIDWEHVEFTCYDLQDRTLLLTFILPQPKEYGEVEYVAIRLKPEEHDEKRAVIYILTKPQDPGDKWDISYLPLPLGADKMEFKFKQKISSTDQVRNFAKDVQQIDFYDDSYNKSILDDFRDIFSNMFRSQDDNYK